MTIRQTPSRTDYRRLVFLLAAISSIGPLSIDTYLPSFPAIGQSLGASQLAVQQTLTAYLAPFSFMALWHGAISDILGRRLVILAGLVLFSLASVGCALANSIESLLMFRMLQGLSSGAGMVVGRAIVRDVLEGAEAQRLMSHVATMFALAPAVAPVLGGWLEVWFGWRSVFVFLVLLAAFLWVWCLRTLPETLPRERRQPLDVVFLLRSYRKVFGSPAFVFATGALTLSFSGYFIYVLSAPVFLMRHLNLGETDFFWLFGPAMAGMVSGAWLSGRLAGRITRMQTVWLGYGVMASAAAGNLLLNLLLPPNVAWSILPIVCYVVGMSLATPSMTLLGLDLFPSQRGLAASCQFFLQTFGSSLNSAVVVPLVWATPLSMASGEGILLSASFLALMLYLRAVKARRAIGSPL